MVDQAAVLFDEVSPAGLNNIEAVSVRGKLEGRRRLLANAGRFGFAASTTLNVSRETRLYKSLY